MGIAFQDTEKHEEKIPSLQVFILSSLPTISAREKTRAAQPDQSQSSWAPCLSHS